MCVYFKLELGLQTWTNDENLGRPPKHKDEIARRDPRHKQDGYPCPKVMLKKHIKLPNQKYKKISLKCNFYYYFLHISSGKCLQRRNMGHQRKMVYCHLQKGGARASCLHCLIKIRIQEIMTWNFSSSNQTAILLQE